MSVLTNKNALIIGPETSLIYSIIESLEPHGVVIARSTCKDVTPELIKSLKTDFIIINNLQHEENCTSVMDQMRGDLVERAIPVFVLVNEDSTEINEALLYGAADYITAHENVQSVLAKVKAVFGQSADFSGSTAIDITPTEATITSTGIRVFVVEDDPLLRNLLSIKLDKSLFPCEFSNDGANVIPVMHQFKPDVIILDLMLPGRSGFEVLEEVRADEKLKAVPVIVFSNRDGQDDRKKAHDLGANVFYVKAMTDLSELIEAIESLAK
jgi:DNA-binding response OmpR family regulator